jgi:putative restriction endonuclease
MPQQRFWWVNQNQTFQYEFSGGYLWSPKTKANGNRNRFYENMKEALPGDVVFSFRKTKIPAAGRVTSRAYECPKPTEFDERERHWGGNWGRIGWRVDVRYLPVPEPPRPKDFIDELRPHLPDKYSPLTTKGDGLQSVYLAEVPPEMAEVLLNLIDLGGGAVPESLPSDGSDSQEEFWLEKLADHAQSEIGTDQSLGETDRDALVKARRGQGRFRRDLLQVEPECRVTGVKTPEYLRASHIWPWRHCDNRERLDPFNGLMLTPSVDLLFDKGHISFSDAGNLLVSPIADVTALQAMGLEDGLNVGEFSRKQCAYLLRHREGANGKGSIFKKVSN